MKKLKSILSIIIWPVVFMIGQFFIRYPFVANFNSKYLKDLKNIIGAERMLWGTDVPGVLLRTSYRELVDRVIECGVFTKSEIPLVMGENAKRVYLK